jgi:hypothetical protein
MPVRRPQRAREPKHPKLVEAIAGELDNTSGRPLPDQTPVIVEERPPRGALHVYVVWNDPAWVELERQERSEVIIDAYEQKQPDDAYKITIAMGLTSNEADRMRINYRD